MESGTAAKSDTVPEAAKTRVRVDGKTTAKKKPKADQAMNGTKLVVFFRHGIAEDPSDGKPDGERSLTTNGHARTKRSAKGLAKVVDKVDTLWSSPLLRALQTSLWVTKAYSGKVKVQTTDALLPDHAVEDVEAIIREAEGRVVVLVGHEPNLTRCMARLLGIPELSANLRRAGCAAVSLDENGHGTLEWMLAPRTLRGI